jgi:hypothetical protein
MVWVAYANQSFEDPVTAPTTKVVGAVTKKQHQRICFYILALNNVISITALVGCMDTGLGYDHSSRKPTT